jgi:hypothetical protein
MPTAHQVDDDGPSLVSDLAQRTPGQRRRPLPVNEGRPPTMPEELYERFNNRSS